MDPESAPDDAHDTVAKDPPPQADDDTNETAPPEAQQPLKDADGQEGNPEDATEEGKLTGPEDTVAADADDKPRLPAAIPVPDIVVERTSEERVLGPRAEEEEVVGAVDGVDDGVGRRDEVEPRRIEEAPEDVPPGKQDDDTDADPPATPAKDERPLPPQAPPSHAVTSPPRPPRSENGRREAVRTSASTSLSHVGTPRLSTSSSLHTSSSPSVSVVFVRSALQTILSSREARKGKAAPDLKAATEKALEMVRDGTAGGSAGEVDPRVIFEPLRLACETRSTPLMITALDCIGKLVSYSFFADEPRFAAQAAATATSQAGPPGADTDTPTTATGPLPPVPAPATRPLADLVTDVICDCFTETIDASVQLQIIKALLSTVLSPNVHVHQGSLLKAVRTVYNVFLMSKGNVERSVAQGALGQMVEAVFGRVKGRGQQQEESVSNPSVGFSARENEGRSSEDTVRTVTSTTSAAPSSAPTASISETTTANDGGEAETSTMATTVPETDGDAESRKEEDEGATAEGEREKVTLRSMEARKSFDALPAGADDPNASTAALGILGASTADGQSGPLISEQELFVKDAFLVFRALCKLSMKPIGSESERDLKSHAMRSKLLSLQLILTILNSHLPLFIDPNVLIHSASTREQTPFVQAVKQYLCLALSRNAISSVMQVFELSCEIFWKVLSGMRTKMKKEIEVLLNEIFLPILEMRTATFAQKSRLLSVFARLSNDPQALVEIYLNYDCDRTALDNIYERLMNIISKLTATHSVPGVASGPNEDAAAAAKPSSPLPNGTPVSNGAPSAVESPAHAGQPLEVRVKRQSLECLVAVLRSLVVWSRRSEVTVETAAMGGEEGDVEATSLSRRSEDGSGLPTSASLDSISTRASMAYTRSPSADGAMTSLSTSGSVTPTGIATPDAMDDPSRFESAKQRKTTLLEGFKRFNFKPKRGIQYLLENGFIRSSDPREIARFLLFADGLSKGQIGEYLGEGDPENIAIMHAFVDFMDFENVSFLEALRTFLQSFRLPGEAQKIDRFMLKFAERYVAGNPRAFANADTAYVLAYSVIMLNTDAHNPQVKSRMTAQDFVKNNRGIDDGKNLPEDFLIRIYNDIQTNEIKMKDEVAVARTPTSGGAGFANAIAAVGRDLQREAYVLQSETMANKSEALFRTMVRNQRRGGKSNDQFFSASHFEHVKPMFEVAWMAFLAGVSGPLQDSDDMEIVQLCLEGFRHAIHIVCLFGMELERNAFVTTLAKFTFLNNLGEMKPKNVEAIKALFGVAATEGNYLKGSWREVLTCVSQLERFQLISNGVDQDSLPQLGRQPRRSSAQSQRSKPSMPTEEVAIAGGSSEVTIAADMIFSSSKNLSGTAIVDFVQSLSDVSWEEIQSSGLSDSPRLFSLQKLVEISYYNMGRIRIEWSGIWNILGQHFNQVCCHANPNVSFFALDALRQLSMRFLEKEELSHFKFQKDFLKPFEYAMVHNTNPDVREMVLQCLQQMIQSRVQNMRSGWRTMFGVFGAASKAETERIASYGFDIVQQLNAEHFDKIVEYGSFADLTVCITDFCKLSKYQKVSLHSIEMLRGVVPKMLASPLCPVSADTVPDLAPTTPPIDDPMVRFWFPALFSFYDIIMNGEDLEVRRVALDSLFETLKKHGATFRPDFWDTVCQEVLFPIFAVLRSKQDVSRFSTQEDMSVWLSTTMIQALRNVIDLWTFFFETLARMLDGLLELLCACICQENDTLARIGTSCLQQLLEKNVRKLDAEQWETVVTTFVQLFRTTTAHQLFDPSLRVDSSVPASPISPAAGADQGLHVNGLTPLSPTTPAMPYTALPTASAPTAPSDRRRIFKQVIVKCVLQLLLIETTHELLQNSEVYETIPADQLLRLLGVLDDSYRFAKRFNADKELRMALWKVGFMKQLPNLLKQESSSAATLVHVLIRMHEDERPGHREAKGKVEEQFMPLGSDVLRGFITLDAETQTRNIAAWTPVVVEILHGFCCFDDESLSQHLSEFYPLSVALLERELAPTTRAALRAFLLRMGETLGLLVKGTTGLGEFPPEPDSAQAPQAQDM